MLSERQLQTLSTSVCYSILTFSYVIGWSLSFLLLQTRIWWLVLLYLFWMYLDRKTPEMGGRSSDWVQSWRCWHYYKAYFPATLTINPDLTLDPKRNYIFPFFPHGIIPVGPFHNISNKPSEFRQTHPTFKVHIAIIHCLFNVPFLRDLGLALGLVSCSAASINYLLSKPGGHIVLLNPGGAKESLNAGQEQYKFYVKNRKGFVKLALRNGTSLVPAITFGENLILRQIQHEKLRRVQQSVQKRLGFMPVLFYGRGFTENSLGVFPMRRPLTTVLGEPIEVVKKESPTKEDIDLLHQRFLDGLVHLFETHKNKFMENPQRCLLLE